MRDPLQYARFSDERSRPFFDLLSRVPQRPFRDIVDLGCGTGELTRTLSDRWPDARVIGLDASPEMLAGSAPFAIPGRLRFVEGDIAAFDTPADLVFSNATLQWLEDHESLFPRLASLVRPGGVLAIQMPSNFGQPSHLLIEETARSGSWSEKLARWRPQRVEPLSWYIDLLISLGFAVDAWETVYYFVLKGDNPVLEWVKGTALQPILSLLEPEERTAFLAAYGERVEEAYPGSARGTLFPFRRIFFIASRQ